MEIDREKILERMEKVFPDRIVYRQMFTPKQLSFPVHYSISRHARAAGQTSRQWVESNGYTWKDTGYIEPDMRLREYSFDSSNVTSLAHSVFRKYPLVGQYELSSEESEALFSAAQDVFKKICREDCKLTKGEALILTFATIQHLKNWSNDTVKNAENSSFWNYIYLQYGFNPELAAQSEQRIYAHFRDAIDGTFELYKRYMAPEDRQRYYTSMLLHAISPKNSIYSLFEILFDFYIKNLDFQYIHEDPIFDALVKGMQARWDGRVQTDESIRLLSNAVNSGLQTLFLDRPGYMSALCDSLTGKIDRLIRGLSIESADRWDSLLISWYKEKSLTERTRLQGEKRTHHAEFVATTEDSIYMRYAVESSSVGIQIPQIRLPSVAAERPVLYLMQGENTVYTAAMSWFGNDLSRTTRRVFVSLDNTEFDFSENLCITGKIEYNGSVLYTSGKSLFRDYICFDANGNERSIRNGRAYLFSSDNNEFGFINDDDVYYEDFPGQLLRVNMDGVGSVTFNGKEIFADEQQSGKVRIYPSVRPVQDISAVNDSRSYQIFDRDFSLEIKLPENENALRYRIMADGEPFAVPQLADAEGRITISAAVGNGGLHSVRVVNNLDSSILCEFNYVILPGFEFGFDKKYYLDDNCYALLTVHYGEVTEHLQAIRIDGTGVFRCGNAPDALSFEAVLPTVSGWMGEDSIFSLPEKLWHGSISKANHIRTELPAGWHCRLMLNTREIEANSDGLFELGNYISSGLKFDQFEVLWLSLYNSCGEIEVIRLTEIYFEPAFISAPITVEDNNIIWDAENCFIGDSGVSFKLVFDDGEIPTQTVRTERTLLQTTEGLNRGRHGYGVYIVIGKSLFSAGKEHLICSEEFFVGEEKEFRFDGCELILKRAFYWNIDKGEMESAEMRPEAGILEMLEYACDSIASGESIELNEYDATLSFETADGRRINFNFNEANDKYEYINPARVWIINDHRLILRAVSDDAVYFDTQYASILNKNHDLAIPNRAAQKRRLQNPDYFDYEIRRVK